MREKSQQGDLPANRRCHVPLLALFPANALAKDKRTGDNFVEFDFREV